MRGAILGLLCLLPFLAAEQPSDFPSTPSLRAKYSRLKPNSLTQNLAFYELYPETQEGQLALRRASKLLADSEKDLHLTLIPLSSHLLNGLVYSFSQSPHPLSPEEISSIQRLGSHLSNRSLQGFSSWKEEEIQTLSPEEIDIARALLLLTHSDDPQKILTYEAYLDFMALQVLASLPKDPTPEEIVTALNELIFFEMHFTFPPHSLWSEQIEHYTFLPSVFDQRKGVCLGVSILYLSLAQRLSLPLEVITPPGHIFLRAKTKQGSQNIETTARGIHIPDEAYLGLQLSQLPIRNYKEVVGMALVNEASSLWKKKNYHRAATLYEKALFYIPEDPLLKKWLGLNYLFLGKKEEGEALLRQVQKQPQEICTDYLLEDYFSHQVDIDGIEALFLPDDTTRAALLHKQDLLLTILQRYPYFRAGLLELVHVYLKLHKEKEALKTLQRLFLLDPSHPTVNYYLSILHLQRSNYPEAWKHLKLAENIFQKKGYLPKALKEIKRSLKELSFG